MNTLAIIKFSLISVAYCNLYAVFQKSTNTIECISDNRENPLMVESNSKTNFDFEKRLHNYFLWNFTIFQPLESTTKYSLAPVLNPVIDERWEQFPDCLFNMEEKKYKDEFLISLSLKMKSSKYHFRFTYNLNQSDLVFYPIQEQKQWNHFKLGILNNEMFVSHFYEKKYFNVLTERLYGNISKFQVSYSGNEGECRLHKYSYYLINEVGNFTQPIKNIQEVVDCLSFYVSMCENCEMQIHLYNHGSSRGKHLKSEQENWQLVKICSQHLLKNDSYVRIKTIFPEKFKTRYWAISYPALYLRNKEKRSLTITSDNLDLYECYEINTNNSIQFNKPFHNCQQCCKEMDNVCKDCVICCDDKCFEQQQWSYLWFLSVIPIALAIVCVVVYKIIKRKQKKPSEPPVVFSQKENEIEPEYESVTSKAGEEYEYIIPSNEIEYNGYLRPNSYAYFVAPKRK